MKKIFRPFAAMGLSAVMVLSSFNVVGVFAADKVQTTVATVSTVSSGETISALTQNDEYEVRDAHIPLTNTSVNRMTSEHFQIVWGNSDTTNTVTEDFIKGNLINLENIRSFYINELNMKDIGISTTGGVQSKYKTNIYVSATGLADISKELEDDWAYMGTDSDGFGFILLAPGAMRVDEPSWVLPHELAHVFTYYQGGSVPYAWYEASANWFRDRYLGSEYYAYGGKTYGPTADFFSPYLLNSSYYVPHALNWYDTWPLFIYISENPDGIDGLGMDLMHKIFEYTPSDSESMYDIIEKLSGVSAKDILGGMTKRLATLDFERQQYYQMRLNDEVLTVSGNYDKIYSSLGTADSDGYCTVASDRMPMQTGFNIIPLDVDLTKKAITADFVSTSTESDADFRVTLVTNTSANNTRYSDTVSGGKLSIALNGDETEAYLVVCATPDTLKNYNVDWDSSAEDEDTRYTYKVKAEATDEVVLLGDADLNGCVDKKDAALLLKYIADLASLDSSALANADCDGVSGIDLRDVQWILNYEQATTTTETATATEAETETTTAEVISDNLIEPTVNRFDPTTPSVGDVKLLVLYVDFPDTTYSSDSYTTSQMQDELFGSSSADYPYDSVSAWYKRASYGNLNIDGDVYSYTCQNELSTYQSDEGVEKMIMEVLSGLDGQINYADYDSDNDGVIDGITFTVPLDDADDTAKDFWYGRTHTWYYNPSYRVDGKKINQYIFDDVMPVSDNMSYLKSTMIHELGHSLGLPDFYKYYSGSDWNGFNGVAGYTMLDDAIGDFCGFAKLMYGWLRESEVQTYTGSGAKTFVLDNATEKGSCLLLPISSVEGDYASEYFLIEYVTDDGNNADIKWYSGDNATSGVRIFHIDAEITEVDWGTSFKYGNFTSYYDQSDSKQRIARLVNDGNGFCQSGDTISYGTTGFAGYDASGEQSVDTGYSVSIDSIADGKCTVTVSKG